jgi:predicted RND superfamily exporter protein
MPDFSDAQTIGILTAIGMILALVAAVTGIISVRQGARAWRASQRPLLQAFVTQNPEDGLVTATISNTGAGSANGTTFVIVLALLCLGPSRDSRTRAAGRDYDARAAAQYRGGIRRFGVLLRERDSAGVLFHR